MIATLNRKAAVLRKVAMSIPFVGRGFAKSPPIPAPDDRATVRAAELARDAARWEEAARLFATATAEHPTEVGLFVQLGNCSKEATQYAGALSAYLAAIHLDATQSDTYIQLGRLFGITGNLYASHLCFDRVFELDPKIPGEWFRLDNQDGMFALSPRGSTERQLAAQSARIVSWAERDFNDTDAQYEASRHLAEQGERHLARALLELAFIRSGLSQATLKQQRQLAARTNLWGLNGPLRETIVLYEDVSFARLASQAEDRSQNLQSPPALFQTLSLAKGALLPSEIAAKLYAAMLADRAEAAIAAPQLLSDLNRLSANGAAIVVDDHTPALARIAERVLCNNLIDFYRTISPTLDVQGSASESLHGVLRAGIAQVSRRETQSRLVGMLNAEADIAPRDVTETLRRILALGTPESKREAFDHVKSHLLQITDRNELHTIAGISLDHALFQQAQLILKHAVSLHPDDHELLFRLGITEKCLENFDAAYDHFRHCHRLAPDDVSAEYEILECLGEARNLQERQAEFREMPEIARLALRDARFNPGRQMHTAKRIDGIMPEVESIHLAPELAPELKLVASWSDEERFDMDLMTAERRYWDGGFLPVLRGICAIRVICVSSTPLTALRLRVDGQLLARVPAEPIIVGTRRKYVFNLWLDFSEIPLGVHQVEAYLQEAPGNYRRNARLAFVDSPRGPDEGAASDAVVFLEPDGTASIEDRVNRLPSSIRSAERALFDRPPERIAVFRVDQLGDLITSVPAIKRLRELLPDAAIVGVVSPANEALARSFGLFDDVIPASMVYSHTTRRRHMQLSDQVGVAKRLRAFRCDLAIDLCPGSDSRPLLKLAGARYMVGFKPHEFPWLTFGVETVTRDPFNNRERVSHATHVLSLVDAIGSALRHRSLVLTRSDIDGHLLETFGISGPFAVLHSGARLLMKRWPFTHFLGLTKLLLQHTDLQIILLSDNPDDAVTLDQANIPQDRVRFIQGNVSFDELDAMAHYCSLFVGNDTGPKHLAALRGAPVVGVHMDQVNWNEWGQEGHGKIVSRRVPCCGCGIETEEDCGKDLACLVNIKPDDILQAALPIIDKSRAFRAASI